MNDRDQLEAMARKLRELADAIEGGGVESFTLTENGRDLRIDVRVAEGWGVIHG